MLIFLALLSFTQAWAGGTETLELNPKQVEGKSETLSVTSAKGRRSYEQIFKIDYSLTNRPYYYRTSSYEDSVAQNTIWNEKGNKVFAYQSRYDDKIPTPIMYDTFPRFLSFWQNGEMYLKNLETGEFVKFPKKVIQAKAQQGNYGEDGYGIAPINFIYQTEDGLVGLLDGNQKRIDEFSADGEWLFARTGKTVEGNLWCIINYQKNKELLSNLYINSHLVIEKANTISPLKTSDNLWMIRKDGKSYLKDLATGWESDRFSSLSGGKSSFFWQIL